MHNYNPRKSGVFFIADQLQNNSLGHTRYLKLTFYSKRIYDIKIKRKIL